jgi:hypothetical protein
MLVIAAVLMALLKSPQPVEETQKAPKAEAVSAD